MGDGLKILFERPFIFAALAYACLLAALDQFGHFKTAPLPQFQAARNFYTHRISAAVLGNPEQKNGKLYFKTSVSSVDGKPSKFNALALYPGQYFYLLPRDSLEVTGSISPIKSSSNPGSFDYSEFMSRKGINSIIYVSSITVTSRRTESLEALAFGLRNNLLDTIYRYLPDKEAGILAPMLVGEQSALSQKVKNEFRDAGVTHILVVSGLNVAYCAALFLWCFRLIGMPFRKAALASLPFIILYVFVTGANPPVLRAGVMAVFVILSLSLKREPLIYQSLALAAVTILAFDPQALFTASFQLSFAATLGIVYLYKYFSAPFENSPKWFRYAFAGVFAVSLSAQAAVLPLLAFYFNRVSLAGLVSNIIIVPLAGFITGAGLVLYIFHFLSPLLASLAAAAALYAIRFLSALVHFFAGLPLATVSVPSPTLPDLIVYYFILWAVFRIKRSPKLIGAAACLLIFLSAFHGYNRYKELNRVEITVFSLKAGGAAYIDFAGRERWLIDGGGSLDSVSDPGERVLAPFLAGREIRRLDKIAVTRPVYSRYGGLKRVIENHRVGEFVLSPEFSNEAGFTTLLELAGEKKIPLREVWAGDRFIAAGSTITVISPRTLSAKSADNSLVIMIESYGKRILFTSDMGENTAELLAQSADISCDALVLADRVTDVFLKASKPGYLVFSKKSRAKGGRNYFFTAEKGAVRIIIERKGLSVNYY